MDFVWKRPIFIALLEFCECIAFPMSSRQLFHVKWSALSALFSCVVAERCCVFDSGRDGLCVVLAQGIEAVFFVKPHLTGRCRVAVATNFAVVPWLRKLRPSGQQLVALAEALYIRGAVGPVKKHRKRYVSQTHMCRRLCGGKRTRICK